MNLDPFLTYMERYNPGYRSRIRGVSEREIALMEELYQRPRPESYKEFLRVMGADSGGFRLLGDSDSSYDSVMERVQERLEDDLWKKYFHGVVIVAVNFFMGDDVALREVPEGEPPVVGMDVTPYMVYSTSLMNLMMNTANDRYGMREHAHGRTWSGTPLEDRGHVTRVLESLGYEISLYSDSYVGWGERADSRARYSQLERHKMGVRVNTNDPKVLDEVEAVVARELGLTPEAPYPARGPR